MRLNHSDTVLDFLGNPVLDRAPDDDHPDPAVVTFRDLAMMALSGGADPKDGAERKAKIFALSLKFYKGKFVKLSVDESALLKELAGQSLTPLAFGRLSEWLEGEPQAVATDADDDTDESDEAAPASA